MKYLFSGVMENLDKLTRAGLFSRNVPRYTSYPTAPQFHDGIGSDHFESWVKALSYGSKVSIYMHVPFCERLCWFCACRTQGVKSLSPVEGYLEVLKVEIAKLAATIPEGVTIARMHWGGGSPTILQPEHIDSIMQDLRKLAPIDDDWEFSVEIDPAAVNEEKLDALARNGMNRASIGVQDFDERVQKAIGREQSYETTKWIVDALRERGVNSINLDIVYGLPFQTRDSLGKTVEQVISLAPDRIALFGYAHVPWMAKRQKMIPEDALAAPMERFNLFNQAYDALENAGYVPLGIDHFAKPGDSLAIAKAEGRLRRNFQGYTDDVCTALIGLGASSISRFPQGYVQNRATTNAYTAEINAGKFAAARGIAMTLDDQIRSRAIETLMCDFIVDLPALKVEFGDFAEGIRPDLEKIAAEFPDFVTWEDDRLTLLPEGFHLTRIVATGLDAYHTTAAKHSQAI